MGDAVGYLAFAGCISVPCLLLNGLNLYPFDRRARSTLTVPIPLHYVNSPNGHITVPAGIGPKHSIGGCEPNPCAICILLVGLPFTPLACLCEATGCGERVSNNLQHHHRQENKCCQFLFCLPCYADSKPPVLERSCCQECFEFDPDKTSERRTGAVMYIGGAAMATMCLGSGCVNEYMTKKTETEVSNSGGIDKNENAVGDGRVKWDRNTNAWIRDETTGTKTEVSNISSPTVIEMNRSIVPPSIKKEHPFGRTGSIDSRNPLDERLCTSGSGLESNKSTVDTSADQLSSQKNMTLSEKVAIIVEQLGVDPSLTTLPKKVAAANEIMGIQGIGTMVQQVETLRSQLGV